MTQTFSKVNDSQTNLYWIETHFKPTETFQNTHFSGCQKGVKKGFIKGEALRLLRANSSENEFKTKISHFRASLIERGYPESLITTTLSDIKFENWKQALLQKCKDKRILSFVTQYRPTVPNLKQILMQKWYLSKQQPLLSEIFQDPAIVSYERGMPRILKRHTRSSQTLDFPFRGLVGSRRVLLNRVTE